MFKMVLTSEFLEDIIEKINNLKDKDINEENTRGILIDPLLQALGWDIFNLNEVLRNEKTSSGGYVDYILKTDNQIIYLEAKQINSRLINKFQTQATNYAYEDNVHFCVLTNGNQYQIFETYRKGTVTDRLLVDIKLNDNEISSDKKLEHINFISKASVQKGNLERMNEILNLQNKVYEVVQTLFSNPNHKFIEIISLELEQDFEPESIRKAIINIGNEINFQEPELGDRTSELESTKEPKSLASDENIKILTDKLPEFRDIFLKLREKIISIGNDIREVFYPQYNALVYKRDTEFTSMKIKPIKKVIRFLFKFGEYEPNLENLDTIQIEPLPKTYRLGRINYMALITKKEQIDDIINLVKQSYDLQVKWRK